MKRTLIAQFSAVALIHAKAAVILSIVTFFSISANVITLTKPNNVLL